ncbi:MAG: hypothetical protein ACRDRB_19535 [Pseudonocardiaceae bacterium]
MTEMTCGVKVGEVLPSEVRALLRQAKRVYVRLSLGGDWPVTVRATKRQVRQALRFQPRRQPLEVTLAGDSLQIG